MTRMERRSNVTLGGGRASMENHSPRKVETRKKELSSDEERRTVIERVV